MIIPWRYKEGIIPWRYKIRKKTKHTFITNIWSRGSSIKYSVNLGISLWLNPMSFWQRSHWWFKQSYKGWEVYQCSGLGSSSRPKVQRPCPKFPEQDAIQTRLECKAFFGCMYFSYECCVSRPKILTLYVSKYRCRHTQWQVPCYLFPGRAILKSLWFTMWNHPELCSFWHSSPQVYPIILRK